MPRFDFRCRDCGHVEERSISLDVPTTILRCSRCDGLSDKQPAAPNFVVTGYAAKNGYSSK